MGHLRYSLRIDLSTNQFAQAAPSCTISSAYNHTRSDLSVFRFLCDLQGQGLQTSLRLRFDELFPGLGRYPRLRYKSVVLSPAKWKLPEAFCKDTAASSPTTVGIPKQTSLKQLKSWLTASGIDRAIRYCLVDQTLYFDPAKDDDLHELLTYAKQHKELYLEEALLPESPTVVNYRGKPLAAEWLVSLVHGERVYKGHLDQSKEATDEIRSFIPGSNWLYYEIYAHAARTNELLLDVVAPFIAAHADQLASWFFIRYNENGNHLRFWLHPLVASGLICDVQLKTCRPELERYAHAGMEAVESVFQADSTLLQRLFLGRESVTLVAAIGFFGDSFDNGSSRDRSPWMAIASALLVRQLAWYSLRKFRLPRDGYY